MFQHIPAWITAQWMGSSGHPPQGWDPTISVRGWELTLALQPSMSGQYPLVGSNSPSVLHTIASNLIASVLAICYFMLNSFLKALGIYNMDDFFFSYTMYFHKASTRVERKEKRDALPTIRAVMGLFWLLAGNSISASSAQGEQFCCTDFVLVAVILKSGRVVFGSHCRMLECMGEEN